ncbi:hypothetical protein Tco_0262295 [Tanacetum coccineum]
MNEDYCEQNSCYYPNSSGFDHPQPPQDSVDCQEALDKILEELEEIKRDQRMLKELKKRIAEEQTAKENMSIEEMRHEQQLVDYKIKEITNDLVIKISSEVRKKEQAYEEEKYSAARRRMLSIPFVDEDDYVPLGDIIAQYSTSKAITPDLPIEEPDNSLNMGDEHLDTIPATESDEVIKSSVENLVPIPSEFEGISDDTSDVLNCDNNRVNVEIDFVESLINHDTSIVHSSKIDPILEEFAGELAHIAPIPPGIVEADFDPNDGTSSDDDVILREKLLNVHRLITKIESLKDNPTPDRVFKSLSSFPIPVVDSDSFFEESDTSLSHLDNSLPEFESFSDHTEETRSGSTTTHANYSLPEYDSFLFEIEPDQERMTSVVISDNSNDHLLELHEFDSFHFDLYLSFPRPPPEPLDVEICLNFEPDTVVKNDSNELNEDDSFDPGGGEIVVSINVEDDESFTFVIRTFLPFVTTLRLLLYLTPSGVKTPFLTPESPLRAGGLSSGWNFHVQRIENKAKTVAERQSEVLGGRYEVAVMSVRGTVPVAADQSECDTWHSARVSTRWWLRCDGGGDDDEMMMIRWRLEESGSGDRIDRVTRITFGFGRKSHRKSFPVAGDGGSGGGRIRRWQAGSKVIIRLGTYKTSMFSMINVAHVVNMQALFGIVERMRQYGARSIFASQLHRTVQAASPNETMCRILALPVMETSAMDVSIPIALVLPRQGAPRAMKFSKMAEATCTVVEVGK